MNKKGLSILIGIFVFIIYITLICFQIVISVSKIELENNLLAPFMMTLLYIPITGISICVYKLNTKRFILINWLCFFCLVSYGIGTIYMYVTCLIG